MMAKYIIIINIEIHPKHNFRFIAAKYYPD
jgi:hypothetical protein